MVQVKADDRRAQLYPLGPGGQVKRQQQRPRQMAVMRVGVVLGEPGILESEPVRQQHLLGDLLICVRRRTLAWGFDVVSEGKLCS